MKAIFTLKNDTRFKKLMMLAAVLIIAVITSSAQEKHIVEVSNNVFTPDELQIAAGDTVEWRNIEGIHNVNGSQGTFPENPESFGNSTGSGWTYSHVFNIAGSYDYRCDPHYTLGMTGKIEVSGNDDDKGQLIVNFTGMDPHVGQTLWLSVVDKNSGEEIERKQEDVATNFSVGISGIETGHSYSVKFFADFNENGSYDAPPVDHAWMLELDNATGDTTLNFEHNTNFTDIMWENRLTVHFTAMTPHVGQDLWLAVVDKNTGMEVDRVHAVVEEEFMVHAYGIKAGESYNVDFFADFNENGMYDAPGDDHAWRLELDNVTGDTTLNFEHNTNFTDIMWENRLTVHFKAMSPHVGQDLWLAVVNKNTGMEVDRVHAVVEEEFMVHAYGIKAGESYNVDFFADFNENGMYDAPGDDHAWRLELDNVTGDTTLNFEHNTNFTDIEWKHVLTVEFSEMTPHIGQEFRLYVVNSTTGSTVDSAVVNSLVSADFKVESKSLMSGESYNINFYADLNLNGSYDAPPVDHAWQIELNNVIGDTTLFFSHNTNFTDIFNVTSVSDIDAGNFKFYPNPASDFIIIETGKINPENVSISIYDITGKLNSVQKRSMNNKLEINVQELKQGIYFIEMQTSNQRSMMKLIKE